jgi:hypothetical protein
MQPFPAHLFIFSIFYPEATFYPLFTSFEEIILSRNGFAPIFGAKSLHIDQIHHSFLKNLSKMKNVKSLLLAAAVTIVSVAQAQTADDIINKHIDALGGKDKISQVKSIYTESSVEVMGNTSTSVESLLQGKGFKAETDFNGMKIINCYTDKGGWAINPFAGGTDAQAMPDEAYKPGKDQIYFGGSLVDYAAKGNKVELLGKEGNDYKLKLTNGSNETTYYIDGTTYLVNKSVAKGDMMGQAIEITTTFSDYKKTDFGITVPYGRNIDFGQFALAYKVNKVEVNKEIDPKIFDMPAK